MFIPVQYIMQNETMINTQEDLVYVLDKFVLPGYPAHTTPNPAFTKAQCYGVVESFLLAGKLHLRFKPVEVEKAVDAFMEDRLWVEKDALKAIRLMPHQTPYGWMAKPSLLRMVWAMVKQFGQLFTNLVHLAKTGTMYWAYSFYSERTFTVPKAPSSPKVAAVRSLKKDS